MNRPQPVVEVRTLRYLVAVAEYGSVNAAAHALHLTQPSFSRQLRQLERRLGVPLLRVRDGRSVLTDEGELLLPHARQVLQAARTAESVARSLAGPVASDSSAA